MSAGETLEISAKDGFALRASVFVPEAPRAVVLVASAMGVPRRVYEAFALHLYKQDLAVVTFDYRGVGDSRPASLRGFLADLTTWATQDTAGVLQWIETRWPTLPVLYVGHSVGGQLLGLLPNRERISAALLVAAQSGYSAHWDGIKRVLMLANWWIGVPLVSQVFGYLPMSRLAGGEDIPKGVAREWAQWGRSPRYVLSSALAQQSRGFETFTKPILAYAFTDDNYCPVRSVHALLGFYKNAPSEFRVIAPRDWQQKKIGHFGCFRRHNQTTFYQEASNYLLKQLDG